MPSVIRINGRPIAATRNYRKGDQYIGGTEIKAPVLPRDKDGKVLDTSPIPPSSPDSPFRVGEPYADPHDQIVYRVVGPGRCPPSEGWGTMHFWTARWDCYFSDLVKLVQMGWLDAAMEQGSATKRFRCREEQRCVDWLNAHGRKPPRRSPAPEHAPQKPKGGKGAPKASKGAKRALTHSFRRGL